MKKVDFKITIDEAIKEREKNFNLEQFVIDDINSKSVKSNVYNCELCKNKGYIAKLNDDGFMIMEKCSCYNVRNTRQKLHNLGLLDFLDSAYDMNLDTKKDDWLKYSKSKAKRYAKEVINGKKIWFYIGGKVGSGKTCRCAYILSKLLKENPSLTIEYFNWDSRYKELSFGEDKQVLIDNLKNADVVYFDDFIRVKQKSDLKDYERQLAKMIVDYRYINNKVTIFSSELHLSEIALLDEALGSRIYQKTEKGLHLVEMKRNEAKNLRLESEE